MRSTHAPHDIVHVQHICSSLCGITQWLPSVCAVLLSALGLFWAQATPGGPQHTHGTCRCGVWWPRWSPLVVVLQGVGYLVVRQSIDSNTNAKRPVRIRYNRRVAPPMTAPLLVKSTLAHLCNSGTRRVSSEKSTDLNMGRRPELKSDEFFGETLLVIEVISLLLLKPLKQVMQLLAARPAMTGSWRRVVSCVCQS